MSSRSDKIRIEWKENDEKRDAGLQTPEYVIRTDNVSYGNEIDQKLDIYQLKGAKPTMPVIISVHGGAWVYGTKETYQFYCMSLVKFGFTVINFTYRLAPENKFPAALEDTNLVMEFIIKNKIKYGFDVENVFAVGDSAGANILGLYACFLTNENYRKMFDFKVPKFINKKGNSKEFRFNAIALNCGAYRFANRKFNDVRILVIQDLLKDGGNEKELKSIDVIENATKDFPSSYIMTSSKDFLKDEMISLSKRFMELSIPFEIKFYSHRGLPCHHVFHIDLKHPMSEKCNKLECDFFKRHIKR